MSSVAALINPIYVFFLVLSACIAVCSCYVASRFIHTTKDIVLVRKCFANCFFCGLFLMVSVVALPYTEIWGVNRRGIVIIAIMILPMIVYCAAYGFVFYSMVYIIVPAEVSEQEEKGNIIKGVLDLMLSKY